MAGLKTCRQMTSSLLHQNHFRVLRNYSNGQIYIDLLKPMLICVFHIHLWRFISSINKDRTPIRLIVAALFKHI